MTNINYNNDFNLTADFSALFAQKCLKQNIRHIYYENKHWT